MVDQYYRKIESVENEIEYSMQISSILLKLKGYDDKLSDLSKIGNNENNISSNLSKIGDNENNISSNLSKIGDNENNISSNLSKIGDNVNNISTNLTKIDNFTQYILKPGKDFEEKYIIKKQIFRFNRDKHFYTIFEKEIEYNITKNSLLFVKNNVYYKYDNLSNDYYRLQHEYNIYDSENNLIHKYLFNKDTYYDENLDPILHTNEDFCICFKKNYKIKLNLQLHRHIRHGVGNIDLEIDDNENYLNIEYLDRNNNENIKKNKNNISTNLKKINNIKNIIRNKIFDETFNLENQKFLISNEQDFKLFSIDINYSFLNKSYAIIINTSFHYLRTNNLDGINHKYVIFDENYSVYGKKKTFYKNSYHNGKIIIDNFEINHINNINEKN